MNNVVKLIISMAANLSGSLIKKQINIRYDNSIFSYQFYNCVVSLASAIVLLIMADNTSCSLFTVITAVIFGLITLIQQITNLYALESGPLSYTSVLISLSSLIPTISGAIFWNEKIAAVQYIGIALMTVSFLFSVSSDSESKKTNKRWLFFCLTAFLCTGAIGVMQKFHQTSAHKDELDSFLIIAFFVSFILSGIHSLVLLKSNKKEAFSKTSSVIRLIPLALMLISGIFVAINNKFNLYLSGVMEAAIFFPTVNGGGLVLTSVFAYLIFKEKLTVKQWVGVIIGIIAVILISNPFQ